MAGGADTATRERRIALVSVAAGLVATCLAVRYLWPAVLTLLIGGAVYYLCLPLISLLERYRVPRLVSTLLLSLTLVGVVVLVVVQVVPTAYTQLEELAGMLPYQAARAQRWLHEHGLVGDGADPRVSRIVGAFVDRSDEMILATANRLLGAVPSIVGAVVTVVLGLVAGVYLLLGGARLASGIADWIPPTHRDRWVRFGRAASRVLGGYLRARVFASIFVGLAYWVAFELLGVDQPVLLAVVGGTLNLVPVIGPLLAAVPVVTVAAFESWGLVLGVVVVQLAAQQVESSLIGPLLEGRAVRLPPAVVVLAVALGSAVAGIAGLLISVPVAGLARVALDVFYRGTWTKPES